MQREIPTDGRDVCRDRRSRFNADSIPFQRTKVSLSLMNNVARPSELN
jgi:hypothetical protein